MNHGSLFSGIGGFDLAAEWMGWNNVFQVEWDEWCRKVLAKNFPNVKRYGDIKEFNEIIKNSNRVRCNSDKWEKESNIRGQRKSGTGNLQRTYRKERDFSIDILTGGFPCQPFSHAGKRKGTDDNRYLWPEMLTTIRIIKPSFVVGENVAGLVSMEDGKTLDGIFVDLEDEGYTVESFIIPACGVGAWHRRDRIWIVAYNNTVRCGNGRNAIKKGSKTRSKPFNRNERLDKDVSNTESTKCKQSGDSWTRGDRFTNSCKDVPHTDCQGPQRRNGRELSERSIKQSFGKGNTQDDGTDRQFESRLGRMVDGLSLWLDEPDIPRVATGIKDRANQLKGLGNAIVPQVALEIFKAIEQFVFD